MLGGVVGFAVLRSRRLGGLEFNHSGFGDFSFRLVGLVAEKLDVS